MRSIGKYLEVYEVPAEEVSPPRKTTVWEVFNKSGGLLGEVKWHGAWRQYCYFTLVIYGDQQVYNTRCLNDISAFVAECNEEWRTGTGHATAKHDFKVERLKA